jgi:hypothetical protein
MPRSLLAVAALVLATPIMADDLSKDVATCLLQARAALGQTASFNGHTQNEQIDAYAARGKIYFHNPFVDQSPTFAFWKCLRLKGYDIPS